MTAVLENDQATDTPEISVAELLERGVCSGSVVVLPDAAGGGTGWLIAEAPETSEARRCAVVGAMTGAVLACGLVADVKVVRSVGSQGAVPEWAATVAGLACKASRAEAERDKARAAVVASAARLERIVDAAHEYADDNSLCEVFDDFMESQGLRCREREYECEVDVTVRVLVRAMARSADAAENAVDTGMVKDALRALPLDELLNSIEGLEVNDVCEV